MPAAQHRAARPIGLWRPRHIGLVRLLPGIALTLAGNLVDRVVQPGVPLRRHFRPFRRALVDQPATLAREASAPAPGRLVALEAIIPVAVLIRSNQRAT